MGVVDDGRFVVFGVAHLLYPVVGLGERFAARVHGGRPHGHAVVVEVQVQGGQRASRVAEGAEVAVGFHPRDAGQLLAQVVGIPLPVARRVEDAVGVVEELFFGEGLAGVARRKVGQAGIGDGVAPHQPLLRRRQQLPLVCILINAPPLLLVQVEGEALSSSSQTIKINDCVGTPNRGYGSPASRDANHDVFFHRRRENPRHH